MNVQLEMQGKASHAIITPRRWSLTRYWIATCITEIAGGWTSGSRLGSITVGVHTLALSALYLTLSHSSANSTLHSVQGSNDVNELKVYPP
jgi:hypothetical protein